MKRTFWMIGFICIAAIGCKKNSGRDDCPVQPPVPPVLLKELTIPNLPSPFYYFEYNGNGQPVFASYASGLLMYELEYSGDRVDAMRCMIVVNKDRLKYLYDSGGRLQSVHLADSNKVVYKKLFLSYAGDQLVKLLRERKSGNAFLKEKEMSFIYHADGNVRQIKDQRYAANGAVERTTLDVYEHYDDKINADGFTLLHNEFFEHLVLLPQVRLQINNPGSVVRTGDGLNYHISYTYSYNDKHLPLIKAGDATISSGAEAGKKFQTRSLFTYY